MSHQVHETAERGFQIAPDAYERGRPDYPTDAVDHLTRTLRIEPGRTVVDVGAGTGKFSRLIMPSGATIVAIEPVEGMRRKFKDLTPGIECLEGSAEAMPLADGAADAIVSAQAFHWFDGRKALVEFRRVLRPKGRLGLIWNVRDDKIDWVALLTALIDSYEAGIPRHRDGRWQAAFQDPTSPFTPLHLAEFRYVHQVTPAMVVDRVASISFIATLAASKLKKVLDQVADLIASHPETAGKSTFGFPYRTEVFWCEAK